MRTRQQNDLHIKMVEAWMKKNSALSDPELTQLLINGILAIRSKSLATLSNVTVTAVIDRILLECQEHFSVLSQITNDSKGLNFKDFSSKLMDFKPSETQEALKEFLLELLEVFGNITADILTISLHKDLMTVTHQASSKEREPEAAVSLSLARKNRDQK